MLLSRPRAQQQLWGLTSIPSRTGAPRPSLEPLKSEKPSFFNDFFYKYDVKRPSEDPVASVGAQESFQRRSTATASSMLAKYKIIEICGGMDTLPCRSRLFYIFLTQTFLKSRPRAQQKLRGPTSIPSGTGAPRPSLEPLKFEKSSFFGIFFTNTMANGL